MLFSVSYGDGETGEGGGGEVREKGRGEEEDSDSDGDDVWTAMETVGDKNKRGGHVLTVFLCHE